MSDDVQSRAVKAEEAGAVLRAGGLVLMPTETFFAVAASARAGVAALRAKIAERSGAAGLAGPLTWHAMSRGEVREALGPLPPAHSRALDRLTPGPIRLVFERDDTALRGTRGRLGVAEGVLDDGRSLGVRVPDHDVASAVLRAVGEPVVAARADALGFGDGVTLDGDIRRAAEGAGMVVVGGGARPSGHGSVTVLLHADGEWSIADRGRAAQDAYGRMARRVLFVCTGNTCRSPMAEAIALHDVIEARRPGGLISVVPTFFESAGLAAGEGSPMTPEAAEALNALRIGFDPHASRQLDAELANRAEVIYAMTRSHLAALQRLGKGVAAKAHLLDPDGEDVPDPIGQGPEVYRETALRLRNLVERRLRELDEPTGAAS